jgi:hypothetical protein
MDNKIEIFSKGIHNVLDDELIPREAASDSFNWITQDGRIKLAGGRQIIGSAGLVGKINALWTGYTTKGVKVLYRKISDKLQYLKAGVWTDILTGLTDTDVSCANYSSLAGAFTLFNSVDGFYLINNAFPESPVNIYNASKNFKGYILVDRGRCLLWNREEDKTGLYGSYIDRQNSTVYTAVTSEAIGALGSTNYTGTLAFKAGGASRICFAVTFSGAYSTGTETFKDNYDGTLTGSHGGTGTINYATGAYNVTFGETTTGAVTANYQWQDFTNKGLADFTKSSPRQAGEGFQFPQDEGGDAILNVVVGQDGSYFSMKSQSAYQLTISDDDSNATNLVYRKDIGIPFWRGVVSTGKGVVFVNTSNPTKPVLTILTKNQLSDAIEPIVLTQHFEYGNYDYSDCSMDTYDRYITICCRDKGQTNNNVILFVNLADQTVDVVKYEARMTAKVDSTLYVGSSISQDVYKVLAGFDDEGQSIQNEWTGRGENFGSKMLKKEKRMRFAGLIDPDQLVEIWADFDNSGYSIIGTISGNASYVDYSSPQAIGYNTIGGQQIGGDNIASAYPFYCELRIKTPKFGKRNIKLIAKGIGYVDFNMMSDNNVLSFEDRLPKKFRTKRV